MDFEITWFNKNSCAFNSAEGNQYLCLSPSCQSNGKHKSKTLVPVVASVALIGVMALMLLLIISVKRKKRSSKALRPSIVAKRRSFSYAEVKEMTSNFSRVVGEGGFGMVYHGCLNRNEQVAAKVLSRSSAQGYEHIKAEVELLIRVHHTNLVSLFGYCDEGDHLVLIYEYMHNEDLRKHLSGQCASPPLIWENRLRIAAETAQGLFKFLDLIAITSLLQRLWRRTCEKEGDLTWTRRVPSKRS